MRTQHQDQSVEDAPDAEKPEESSAQIFVQKKKGGQDDAAEEQESVDELGAAVRCSAQQLRQE